MKSLKSFTKSGAVSRGGGVWATTGQAGCTLTTELMWAKGEPQLGAVSVAVAVRGLATLTVWETSGLML